MEHIPQLPGVRIKHWKSSTGSLLLNGMLICLRLFLDCTPLGAAAMLMLVGPVRGHRMSTEASQEHTVPLPESVQDVVQVLQMVPKQITERPQIPHLGITTP